MTDRSQFFHPPVKVQPPLDPDFVPPVLSNRLYRDAVQSARSKTRIGVALEREDGRISREDIDILDPAGSPDPGTLMFVERHIKFLLWARGGWRLFLSGPQALCREIAHRYSETGKRAFDAGVMATAYDRPLSVEIVTPDALPASKESGASLGGHLDGCRVGFDLGASDYKLAAVQDGEPVFSKEIPWDPVPQRDPSYHVSRILSGLKEAASHLPRVDAIGGSAAGLYVNNEVKLASLFRSISPEDFRTEIRPMFLEMQKEFNVPFVVVNDGEVTALAGGMSLETNGILGIAMGSSEAAGYLDMQGRIGGTLNELAFAPVDFSPSAPEDEWSGDCGVGALYFSQQAVGRLVPRTALKLPEGLPLPEQLKAVQEKADEGEEDARRIFQTIGTYFGYTLPHYADYYDFRNVLVLGRVTSGTGGELLLEAARHVLKTEFPEMDERFALRIPDEKSRRVGQAVAAASLPEIRKGTSP